MNNMRDIVDAVVQSHPEFHQNEDRDAAKAQLLPYVVDALNRAQNTDKWGFLIKTDQGNKIPNDIVCWRDTREIVDVLSDDGAMWDYKGVAPNPGVWNWGVSSPVKQPPIPIPTDEPATASLDEIVQAFAAVLVPAIENTVTARMQTVYDQNERIFANLTAQNIELKSILQQLTAYATNTLTAQGAGTVLRPEQSGGIHLPAEAVGRVADVAASVLQILANRRR